jgi:U32 family peptidase
MKKKPIGRISNYFSKIGVAVVEVEGTMKSGDKITIGEGEGAFTQTVGSMQIEHENVNGAKKGQSIGMKVDQEVKKGWKLYKE